MTSLEIDGIGPVEFYHSRRAKRLIISVKPHKGVRVAIPRGSSKKEAREFVLAKKDWVARHLARVKTAEAESAALPPIDRNAARRELIVRLEALSEKHGFSYNKVTIRNQRTRWGSCSPKNNISLNMKLVRLPSRLVDYVILHELVHTRIKNHSPEFWNELDRYVGNARKLRSRMKAYWLGVP